MAEQEEAKTTHTGEIVNSDTNTQNEAETKTETEREVSEREELKPWEQHWGVISIPRFDYNAPSSLINHSHFGFLITCTIKREKSATKEAMSILAKYLGSFTSSSNENLETTDESVNSKRRKICTEDLNGDHITDNESGHATNNSDNQSGGHANSSSLSSSNMDLVKEKASALSLVKLTRSGLLLFTFTRGTSFDVVHTVVDIIQSLESEGSTSPQWCHRIFPIQATCVLNEMELRAIVSKLVLEFVNDKRNTISRPLKFAVGYNRRGVEETEMKKPKDASDAPTTSSLLNRNHCFSVVAGAVNDVVPDSVVDLKSPELSVLVELLPLSGVPSTSVVVAVSVLPQNLVSTKPKLCVRPLVSSAKAKSGKQ